MQGLHRHRFPLSPLRAAVIAALALMPHLSGWTADIDIYGPAPASGNPNVLFFLDNTSNWSSKSQNWNAADSWSTCNTPSATATEKTQCQDLIQKIYYPGATASTKFPWTSDFARNRDNVELEQGKVQVRALKLVLNEVVCNAGAKALNINIGLATYSDLGSVSSPSHNPAYIAYHVQPLTGPADSGTCKTLLAKLDQFDAQISDPNFKAPKSAIYPGAMFEIFKYFGGYTNPSLVTPTGSTAGAPTGATAYGPVRFANKYETNPIPEDPAAFKDGSKTEYLSPITVNNACVNNYLVVVGNGYKQDLGSTAPPWLFSGLNYLPPALLGTSHDPNSAADEWAQFLANTDVSPEPGIQRVFTYTVDTYKDNPDADQSRVLSSMAAVGDGSYLRVNGDLRLLVDGFKDMLTNIAAVNSVFTATTLPVSTTTQGTFLNQIFVGMFRPDANRSPRWVGNLKQYELGFVGSSLELIDKNGKSAVASGTGFFNSTAESLWTEDSVFFAEAPSGTPPSASDRPDGPIVEKGGAAQQLRKANLQGASTRNVKTLKSGALVDFTAANITTLAPELVVWARGENNVAITAPGREEFSGSWLDGSDVKKLGATGARHSMHGDVLHSRPVALNYGDGNVAVYYGTNDGFLRAVNGNKTGTGAGQELWSFIAPEFYGASDRLLERLRAGTPELHLPETNASGGTVPAPDGQAAKSYGMDGPIGVYARYNSSGAISGTGAAAWIFPTMRRGGRSVYAFDVTNRTAPAFKWRIQGGTGGDFDKLGQTWSMPKAVVFKDTGSTPKPPILIMGGGYDPAEDTNGSSEMGKFIYIIRAGDTPALLKALPTDAPVPSDVTIVDVDGNGDPDRAYVADVRGNLYRIDLPTSGDRTVAAAWDTVEIRKIAKLEGKVFYPPDVVVTKRFVAVMVGTGDREKPLMTGTSDRFFLIRDKVGALAPTDKALELGNLTHIAAVDNATMTLVPKDPPSSATNGCYISLATNGEKVVNAPFTIAGATYFGTNRPTPTSSTSCTANLGEAYAYKFPLFCTVPATPTRLEGGGLPPSPVGGIVTIDVNGVPTKVPFLIGGGKGGSAFKPEEPKPPVPPRRTRQNWRIDNTNR